MSVPIFWTFERPVSVNGTVPANITWNPRTFNSVNFGSFDLNMWLLRADDDDVVDFKAYPPKLLFADHNVFNNSVIWVPDIEDIDIGPGIQHHGVHQLAWEKSEDNVGKLASNTSFKGFSMGFNIKMTPSMLSALSSTTTTSLPTSSTSSSASSIGTTSSSGPTTSSTPGPTTSALPNNNAQTNTNSSMNQSTILGLGIGLGLLILILFIVAGTWAWRHHRKRKAQVEAIPSEDYTIEAPSAPPAPPAPPRKYPGELNSGYLPSEMSATDVPPNYLPAELPSNNTKYPQNGTWA